jgi:hypothetical protein
MTTRERFHAVMGFRPFDRLPVLEWAPWWELTITRWHREGLPAELTDRYGICRHFGLEIYKQDWFRVFSPDCPQPTHYGAGIIATEADYERIRKYLFPPEPVDHGQWEAWAREQADGDVVLWFTVEGFFWLPRKLLGIERHLYAFYDQPALVHRINLDLVEWIAKVIDQVSSVCTPDFMTFAEDMSYNHGAMLSEPHFDDFLRPYYEMLIPRLKAAGILSVADSDGDITVPVKWFDKVGLDGVLPLERQANVDVADLRAAYPDTCFIGHFNKMTMSRGEAAMRAEFERLLPVAAQGGFLPACDHQTPPDVSYDDYRLYVKLFHQYAAAAGRLSADRSQ